jgi:hypothetical protein
MRSLPPGWAWTTLGQGGPVKAYQTFGTDLNKLLEELNEALAA